MALTDFCLGGSRPRPVEVDEVCITYLNLTSMLLPVTFANYPAIGRVYKQV